jgi:hypothetical protein
LIGSLVFCFLLTGCRMHGKQVETIRFEWNGSKPVAIVVPRALVKNIPADSLNYFLSVRLAGNSASMLGDYSIAGDDILFRPLIPLSRGLEYEIWSRSELIKKISVPTDIVVPVPAIIDIYPTIDTVPENLLKMHILFSVPMQEGALQHIRLVKNGRDTVQSVFLDLQPELWNNEKTSLTLWLDPGRIKRDLQPNKELGNPLRPGEQYELIIGSSWQSEDGALLGDGYRKKFVVGNRDDESPDPLQWEIIIPKAGSGNELKVLMKETLDFALLEDAIHILDEKGGIIKGKWVVGSKEKEIIFTPVDIWKPARYTIEIESRLEDLAGNNLNRLFDSDLKKEKNRNGQKSFKRFIELH